MTDTFGLKVLYHDAVRKDKELEAAVKRTSSSELDDILAVANCGCGNTLFL